MSKKILPKSLAFLLIFGVLIGLKAPTSTFAQIPIDQIPRLDHPVSTSLWQSEKAYSLPDLIEGSKPVAVADNYSATSGVLLSVAAPGVLVNDTDPDGDPLTAILVGDGTPHGALVLNNDGSFTYTSEAGYIGPDVFVYQANDGQYSSTPVAVTITVVQGANSPPVAVADTYSAEAGTTLSVPAPGVLANDTDADADPLTSTLVGSGTAFGDLTLNNDGSFVYTPDTGYTGMDTFTYQASDGEFTSNPVLVTINVTSTNNAPVAIADIYAVELGNTLSVPAPGVLANDTDADGDPLTAILVGAGTPHGSLTFKSDGSFVYIPDTVYIGPDVFVYQVSDGLFTSNPINVTINVTSPGNTPPVATADTYSVESGESLTVPAPGVLSNDYDADGDALTAELVGAGTAHGSLTINNDGSFTYTPVTAYIGPDTFVYEASDGLFTSNPVIVTINVISNGNTPPVAVSDTYTAETGNTLTVPAPGVLTNDYDADGDTLSAQLVGSGTAHGSLTFNTNGSFTYTPAMGYIGPDQFVYQVLDGLFTSNPVIVTINVTSTYQHPPLAVADSYTAYSGLPFAMPAPGILYNDSDPDGDKLVAQLVGEGTAHGDLTLKGDGSFIYVPDGGYIGPDTFAYQVYDGLFTSNPVIVSINVNANNSAPVANPDVFLTAIGATLIMPAPGVLINDTDANFNPLTAILVTNVSNGNLTLHADGSFMYTPNPGFSGTDSFTYEAYDGILYSPEVTVTILVTQVQKVYIPMLCR